MNEFHRNTEGGSHIFLHFVPNGWEHMTDVPTRTALSDTLSKDLKKKGLLLLA
jgi:3-methyladenine DNA glycosylase Tag